MPTENAIELFNCSLCSYCETSLDGLATHIRKHIKPEPESNKAKANEGNTDTREHTDHRGPEKSSALMNLVDSSIVTSSTMSTSTPLKEGQSQEITNDTNPISPRIEVINPRTVAINGIHTLAPNDSQSMQPVVSTYKTFYVATQQEKTVAQVSYARNITPQQPIRNANMHGDNRLENIAPVPPPPRYVQLHPREPQYIEINSPHHPYSNQYVNNIAAKQPHGHMTSDRIMNIPRNIAPAPPLSSPNRLSNNEARMRTPHSYEVQNQSNMHLSYQNRHSIPPPPPPMENSYRYNIAPSNHPSSSHPNIPPSLKSQRTSHPTTASPLNSPFNTPIISPHNHKQQDDRIKQYHLNRMSGLQLSEVQKHSNPHSVMGIPNSGSVYLNPEQVFGAGNPNVDHLAGVLVVPLKKTSEVACQTEHVYIGGKTNDANNNSRGIQTDLLMGQVRESHSQSSTPVFGTFRSTDDMYECLVCGEEFASDHHLQEHLSKAHTHVCEKCDHSSTSISEHNIHITDCGNRDTQMICLECNTTFASLKRLNQHRSKIHNVRMPFRCGVCNVPFETHEAVMKHISTHDMDVPEFKCRYCVKVFQSADGLSKHIIRHKGVDVMHECRFCKKSYSTGKLLNDHISYVHVIRDSQESGEPVLAIGSPGRSDKNMNDDIPIPTSKKYPLCRHCDLAFKNGELLAQHIDNCSKNSDAKASAFICDVCKEYYPSDLHRKQHLKKEHKRDSGFRCPKCSKIYRTWSRLKFHTKQQHLKKICSECPMIFTKEHILRKHQEDEHGKPQGQPGDRVYTCSLCHTMLNTLTELMTHRKEVHPELSEMRTADRSSNATMLSYIDNSSNTSNATSNNGEVNHLKTYPVRGMALKRSSSAEGASSSSFKCETCGLFFEDEKRLKNHKGLIHGEMPFKCNLCSKAFQYSSQVVWHMRSHKQQDKTTKVSSKLWKSKNKKFTSVVKTGKFSKARSTYVCQFCGAKFSQEKLLKNHKGSVHKIKLFSCDICSFQCGHSTELIWHIRTCRAKFKRKFPDSEFPTKDNKSARMDTEAGGIDSDGYVCHVCDSAFTIFENYQSHMKTHPGEDIPVQGGSLLETNSISTDDKEADGSPAPRLRNPSSSNANFAAEELLNIEPEFDQGLGEFVCPVCQKTTRSMTGMKTHYGRVHGVWSEGTSHIDSVKPKPVEDSIWPCKNCDRQFASLGSLRHHSSVIHGFSVNREDVDVIKKSDVMPMSPGSTAASVASVHGTSAQSMTLMDNASYSCPYCEAVFSKSKSIRVHAFKKHGTVLTDDVVNQWRIDGGRKMNVNNIDPETIRYRCYKCKTKFRSTKSLRVHSLKQHNLLLSKKEMLRTKIRIKLPEGMAARPKHTPSAVPSAKGMPNEVFPCEFCGRVFTNHRAYFTHYRQAHRDSTEQLMSPKKPSKNEIINYTPPPPRKAQDLNSITQQHQQQQQQLQPQQQTAAEESEEKLGGIKNENIAAIKQGVECPTCGNTFKNLKGLYTHLYAAHHITKEHYPAIFPNGMPTLPKKEATCPSCNRVCVDHRAMRIHIFKAHGILYKDMTEEDLDAATTEGEEVFLDDKDVVDGGDDRLEEAFNDNELRVLEAELGPPNCFICGRLFKSRRALMTHEYKYHGIRWVGNKRIFPQQVRNVPNVSSYRSNPPSKLTESKMVDDTDIDGFPNDSTDSAMYSGFNSLDDGAMESGVDSNYQGDSESPVPEPVCNELCPKCPSRFHNRRALTTHLVRIHKYKKSKLHEYFGSRTISQTHSSDNVDNQEIGFDQDVPYSNDEIEYNNEDNDIEFDENENDDNEDIGVETEDIGDVENTPGSVDTLAVEAAGGINNYEPDDGDVESYADADDGDVGSNEADNGEAFTLNDNDLLQIDEDVDIDNENFEENIADENFGGNVVDENFGDNIVDENYDGSIVNQNYEANIVNENYDANLVNENYDDNIVDINENEGDCDTIKPSDIEAYEGIGKDTDDMEVNEEIDDSDHIGVNDIENIIGASIFNGKYDMNVTGGTFDEIST